MSPSAKAKWCLPQHSIWQSLRKDLVENMGSNGHINSIEVAVLCLAQKQKTNTIYGVQTGGGKNLTRKTPSNPSQNTCTFKYRLLSQCKYIWYDHYSYSTPYSSKGHKSRCTLKTRVIYLTPVHATCSLPDARISLSQITKTW